VDRPKTIWGGRILTLYLNYVAGYTVTGPLLSLFERTHKYPVDDQGLLPWWLQRLGESKVRSASLVKVLSGGKIFWVLWSQSLRDSVPPTTKQNNLIFFQQKKRKKKNPEGETPALFAFESYFTGMVLTSLNSSGSVTF